MTWCDNDSISHGTTREWRHGTARHGTGAVTAWHGTARPAWHGTFMAYDTGRARHDRHGIAWHGMARHGTAWHGNGLKFDWVTQDNKTWFIQTYDSFWCNCHQLRTPRYLGRGRNCLAIIVCRSISGVLVCKGYIDNIYRLAILTFVLAWNGLILLTDSRLVERSGGELPKYRHPAVVWKDFRRTRLICSQGVLYRSCELIHTSPRDLVSWCIHEILWTDADINNRSCELMRTSLRDLGTYITNKSCELRKHHQNLCLYSLYLSF